MAMNCHKKLFICQIKDGLPAHGQNLDTNASKVLMKASISGIITGIRVFSRRTVYAVDDGTGLLNCVLWHNDSASSEKMNKIRMNLNADNAATNSEMNAVCQLLLNKVQINEEEPDYIHGDMICCLGIIKLVKGELLLDIKHHYRSDNVNAETLWILDVLSCHQKEDK